MENLWKTTPAEDALILLSAVCFCFAACLFLLAILNTVRAVLGHYSKASIAVYWIYMGAALLLFASNYYLESLLLFSFGSPVAAFGMRVLERERIKQLNTKQNVSTTHHA